MEFTWLGQSGLHIRFSDGRSLLFDPYLSNYIAEKENPGLQRLLPVREEYLKEPIDLLLLSHAHSDHTDPDTLSVLFENPSHKHLTILGAHSVWEKLRGHCPDAAFSYALAPGCEVSPWEGVLIRSVPAFHSDTKAIGFLIQSEGLRIYLSGDTLYHPGIVGASLGEVDISFLCINGAGNNMNWREAIRLAEEIGTRVAIPVHWDMLPGYTADPMPFVQGATRKGIRAQALEEYRAYPADALCAEN